MDMIREGWLHQWHFPYSSYTDHHVIRSNKFMFIVYSDKLIILQIQSLERVEYLLFRSDVLTWSFLTTACKKAKLGMQAMTETVDNSGGDCVFCQQYVYWQFVDKDIWDLALCYEVMIYLASFKTHRTLYWLVSGYENVILWDSLKYAILIWGMEVVISPIRQNYVISVRHCGAEILVITTLSSPHMVPSLGHRHSSQLTPVLAR